MLHTVGSIAVYLHYSSEKLMLYLNSSVILDFNPINKHKGVEYQQTWTITILLNYLTTVE